MTDAFMQLITNLLLNQFIAGGILMQVWISVQGFLTLATTYLWKKIKKQIVDRIYFTVSIDEYDELAKHIESFCAKHNQSTAHCSARSSLDRPSGDMRSSLDMQRLTASLTPTSPALPTSPTPSSKIEYVPKLENDLEFTHTTKDGTPYTVWIGSETLPVNPNISINPNVNQNIQYKRYVVVSMLHWRKNILKEFLEIVQDHGKQQAVTTVSITTIKGGYTSTIESKIRPLSSVILPKGVVVQVAASIEKFLNGSAWYAAHGIPYRYGLLLEGIPGCGKTSLAQALAGRFRLPIISITNVNEITNVASSNSIVGRMTNHIVLLEDIDCQTQNRNILSFRPNYGIPMMKEEHERAERAEEEFQKKQWDITFSHLLNYIDGVAAPEGRIIIMTTNHKEQLDPALIRPGRINMSINFSYAEVDQIARAIQRFYHCDIEWLTEHSTDVEQTYVSDLARTQAELFMKKLDGKKITMSGITNHFMNNKESFEHALAAEIDAPEKIV